MNEKAAELVWKALDKFNIELPSWGFANTGTRFGKFIQPAAATTIEEKFSDAAQVQRSDGCVPNSSLARSVGSAKWIEGHFRSRKPCETLQHSPRLY